MAIGLTEEHQQLAESVRGWAQRGCPPETVRAAAADPDGGAARYRDSTGPALAAQGLPGLHLPESAGGQGFGLPELAVALEELGRALVPGAFLPTVLASAILAEARSPAVRPDPMAATVPAEAMGGASTQREDDPAQLTEAEVRKLLAGLADGSLIGAVCLVNGLTGKAGADGLLTLNGTAVPVLGAGLADVILVPYKDLDFAAASTGPAGAGAGAGEVSAEGWAVVDASALTVTALDSLDLTRPVAEVTAADVTVPAGRLLPGLTRATVTQLAIILASAEAAGLAGWATQTAADYARLREQFGRPIGQFQAVKHRCAWMLTSAELAAAAAWGAAGADPGRDRECAAAVAAVLALDAAVSSAHECIQVLGGIGYTWEHEAHLYYRRAMSLRALLGPAQEWARESARLALAGALPPVRVELPGGGEELRARLAAELAPIAAQPRGERARALAGGGWVLPHLPRPWGREAGALEQAVIAQELTAAGLAPPSLMIGAWVVPALVKYGTAAQQDRFLPPTLRGEIIWCQLFSEPGAGSDLAGLSTRAVRAPGGWRLTGQKIWTSLAAQAAWAICIARTDPASPRHGGISYFLVDMSDPGVEVRPLRELTGESFFNEVFLDEVFVPDDCLVGEVNGGWRIARTTLANERVSLSRSWTFGCGLAELLEQARASGLPASAGLGRLIAEGHAIDLLGLRVTMKQLSGTEPGATGSVRKLLGMRHAQRVAEFCWAAAGPGGALGGRAAGNGAAAAAGDGRGAHWARQVLTTRALTIGGGTTDIQLNIIGERILGLPRDPDPPSG
jgi:alkylation response protein AidB-like acyl-CoA dehydrogenase